MFKYVEETEGCLKCTWKHHDIHYIFLKPKFYFSDLKHFMNFGRKFNIYILEFLVILCMITTNFKYTRNSYTKLESK